MARNANWYNLNATRAYPLDDAATGVTDSGAKLPADILVDCHLRFPKTAGQYLFIGGVTVTPNVVTLVLLGADSPDSVDGFTPLAAVTVQQPVTPFQHYAVSALSPGVGGFVVFQDVIESFTGRFSSPAQSRLAPRCSRPYDVFPIPNVRKKGRVTSLSGLVNIVAGTDLEIVPEAIEIDGRERNAIVIRLRQDITGRNVLSDYIGPCGARPESRNCAKEAIETINGVGPDCNGNLNIVFDGVLVGTSSCGFEVYDQSIGLDEVCAAQATVDFTRGRDLCESSSSSASASSESSASSSAPPPTPSSSSSSSASPPCAELPYCESFDTYAAPFFEVMDGAFTFTNGDSPEESCRSSASVASCSSGASDCLGSVSFTALSGSTRNVAVWDACAYVSSLEKRITTDIRFGTATTQRNAGVVVNYHLVDPLTNPHVEYFLASLDQLNQKLRLHRVTGAGVAIVHEVTLSEVALLNHWYHLRVDVEEHPSNPLQTVITVAARGVTDPGWPAVSFSVSTSKFLPDDGLYGLGTDRSHAQFSYFKIEELP